MNQTLKSTAVLTLAAALSAAGCAVGTEIDQAPAAARARFTKVGYVTAAQIELPFGPSTFVQHNVAAGFYQPGTRGEDCVRTMVAGCRLDTCTAAERDDGRPVAPNAGAIELTVDAAASAALVLTPDADGRYAPAAGPSRLWNAGDPVRLRAAGNDAAPGFDVTLTAPGTIDVSAPGFAYGQPTVIDRAADLEVAWTNPPEAAGAEVLVFLTSVSAQGHTDAICRLPAGPGRGAVPAAVLARLPAGGGAITVAGINAIDPGVQGWDLTLSVAALGRTAAGPAAGPAQFD